MLEPVHFTTPERKNCVFNRALLEWMMVNGHVGQLTPRHIYLRTLWKTISQWKQNFLVFMLPIRCVYGSRWLKIFHDIPNKYRHGASPPWTLKTPCDFYSLHRWCTSSTKEVTQESSAVNAPTRRDSESKVEYLGQVGGRPNRWMEPMEHLIQMETPLRKAPYYHMSQLFGTFYQTSGFCVFNGYDL